jgi:predicted nucleic acid-binding protein
MNYLLDTCVINHIIENNEKLTLFMDLEACKSYFYISHVQNDELERMKDKFSDKYAKSHQFLLSIKVLNIPTSVFVLGVSRLNSAKLGDGVFYQQVLNYMMNKNSKKDHYNDAVIADTADRNDLILITDDKLLYEATKNYHGRVMTLGEFCKESNEVI